jgi:hypothetical protein
MSSDREKSLDSSIAGEDAAGIFQRVRDQTKETASKAKDGLVAGASGLMDVSRTVANETRERAGRVVEFVREAESDEELRSTVAGKTERSLDRAGDALAGAAPAIGRNAELAAEKLGGALHAIAGPLATILGAIAGTIGGWWKKAAAERYELSRVDEEACRAHFTTVTVLSPGMTYERARTGYALGYVASRNPGYAGRNFDEIEADLRQGFGDEGYADYEALREFTRYGYDRGAGRSFQG